MKSFSKKWVATFALTLTVSIAVANAAQARLNITPLVISGWEYNANFWKSETDEVAVDTFYVMPGVTLGYETGKSKVDMDLLLQPYWYSDRDTLPAGVRNASDDDYVGFKGELDALTQVSDRMSIGIEEFFNSTRDAAQADVVSDSTDRSKYNINVITPKAYYDFGNKFGLEVKYSNTYKSYKDDSGEGSTQNKGLFNVFYNMNPRSSFFLSYGIWQRDYDKQASTYTSNEVKLNYTRQMNNFSFIAGTGYHNRSFKDDTLTSIDMFSWNFAIEGQDPPAPSADPRAHMYVSLGQSLNDDGAGNDYFIATRLDAQFGYVFIDKIDTILKGYFQNSNYQNHPGNRDDDTYSASALVGYRFWQHGRVNFELGLRNRDSNITGKTYDDSFCLVTLEFDYNIAD